MSAISYNLNIPDGPNNPSDDQPLMKINTNAIDTILAVDHVSFNANNGGTHDQVTFSSENTPAAQTDPQSVAFTAQASTLTPTKGSSSNIAQLFYRNFNSIFPLSAIKAFGLITAGPTLTSSFNADSVAFVGPQTWEVTLTTGATIGTNVIVFVTSSAGNVGQWTFTANKLSITNGAILGGEVSFVILQI